ncbi:MAG: ferrous iron transport protein B [Nitrososphaerota archaeon]
MDRKKYINIALAGNANVGKSAIFNQLTGLSQVIGNWPGKTVEKAEGTLFFQGYRIHVLDLPGIYSLSTFSIEEIIARDYIAIEKPDIIVNVIDASNLERNLYFTIQLLELQVPMIIALNQMDFATKKGIKIDVEKFSKILGIPVIPTVAIKGEGIKELLSTIIDVIEKRIELNPSKVKYGKEVEVNIEKLENIINEKIPELCKKYPSRWISIKLIEKDEDIIKKVKECKNGEEVLAFSEKIIEALEQIHGEPSIIIIASERYSIANQIAKEVIKFVTPPRVSIEERISDISTHKILGYIILILVMSLMFSIVFLGGNYFSEILYFTFEEMLIPIINNLLLAYFPPFFAKLINEGILSGIIAGITIVLPYVIPFYIILAILEDSGYLPRAAFLMDSIMHKIGLHGKAFIPLILGYGCNVPACIGCRIMETERERFLAAFVTVLIPCSARTVIILGLVGEYIGLHAVLLLYLFDLILVFILGRIAFKTLPGEPIGLIMEMPPYKLPLIKNIIMKTWARTKDFIYVAFPLIIGGSIILEILILTGLVWQINDFISPLIVNWLGLPKITGIPLIFGILRKELSLILLSEIAGTLEFNKVLTSIQMIVFSIITMIYIPCISTIAALKKEFNWIKAISIAIVDVLLALLIGGLAYRILSLFF